MYKSEEHLESTKFFFNKLVEDINSNSSSIEEIFDRIDL